MNSVKIKGVIASNKITNGVAEVILNFYTLIRKKLTGSYTKNGEDLIVLHLLERYTNKPVSAMKYVDIGANHYRRGNNTYLFYERGARGILVEADPELCKRLKRHREEDKVVNVAIDGGGEVSSIPFYILSLPTRSSMDKKHVEESVKAGLSVKEIIDIPCRNLNELLNECNLEPDYLSIDIEGMDFKALRTLDFNKYKIKVIVAEKSNELNEKGESMDTYMAGKGYIVEAVTKSNRIYRRIDD